MEQLLKPAEAARLLAVSIETLYTWAQRRQIPTQRVGHALRFSPRALKRWLSGRQERPSDRTAYRRRVLR